MAKDCYTICILLDSHCNQKVFELSAVLYFFETPYIPACQRRFSTFCHSPFLNLIMGILTVWLNQFYSSLGKIKLEKKNLYRSNKKHSNP